MVREILCNKNNCLFVLPYVSIVQEKIRTLSPLATALQFAIEEYAGHTGSCPPRMRKSERVMYVATLEKAQFVINFLMEEGRLKEIGIISFQLTGVFVQHTKRVSPLFASSGLVVVDEIHIVGEGRRGAMLETLLCKLLLAPASPRIVAMSATIGNISELSHFLKVRSYSLNKRLPTFSLSEHKSTPSCLGRDIQG